MVFPDLMFGGMGAPGRLDDVGEGVRLRYGSPKLANEDMNLAEGDPVSRFD